MYCKRFAVDAFNYIINGDQSLFVQVFVIPVQIAEIRGSIAVDHRKY